jgi:cyclic pyranopterin phosphate synthase
MDKEWTMADLSHLNENGAARMVDIGGKSESRREAVVEAIVTTTAEVIKLIGENLIKKGDVLATARIAGIMAAKKTSELIPLCHPIPIDSVEIAFEIKETRIAIKAFARNTAKTGLEMEAMTAAAVAALTIYDMCKAVDKEMTIESIRLLEKSGGKSGHFLRS